MSYFDIIDFTVEDKISFLKKRGFEVKEGYYTYPSSPEKHLRWEIFKNGTEYMYSRYQSTYHWLEVVFRNEMEKKIKEILLS